MTWIVPRMWDGGECWIIGGGPSMPRQFGIPEDVINDVVSGKSSPSVYSPYMEAIHKKHVIAINVAYLIGDWIDIMFFGDNKFYLAHRQKLAQFPGLKISCNPKLAGESAARDGIKYLAHDKSHGKGVSTNPRMVSWNGNSGAAAISVAVNAGVKRIVLLGFDMKLNETQQTHWHNLYKVDLKRRGGQPLKMKLPFGKHLKGFPQIATDAQRLGVEILNASPDSAIDSFRKVTVKEILNEIT